MWMGRKSCDLTFHSGCTPAFAIGAVEHSSRRNCKVWGRRLTLHFVEQGKQSNQASVSLAEQAKGSATVVSVAYLFESGSDVRTVQELWGIATSRQ